MKFNSSPGWVLLVCVFTLLSGSPLANNPEPIVEGESSGFQGQDPELPVWQWPWERIEAAVYQARAGQDLTPESWPGGNRVAVALSFDLDDETLGLASGQTSPALMAEGAFGSRAGLPRVLDLLQRYDIPASFFIPAVVARLNPDAMRQIVAAGHEIGIHGWIHEANSELTEAQEREVMGRAIQTIEGLTSKKVIGIRTPSWDYSAHTAKLVGDYGLLYDSSLMADDRPYQLIDNGVATRIVELPVSWVLDDWPYFAMTASGSVRSFIAPDDVLEIWKLEFDLAYEEGSLFLLTMHPHIIGRRSRIAVLEGLVRHLRSFSGVWFATHEQVARAAAEQLR